MFDRQQLEELRQALDNWEETTRQQAAASMGDRRSQFITTSSSPVHELYTPLDIANLDYDRDLGLPGEYPFTRGVHPTMYRGRMWTMRMFAGFGTAEETNRRFHYLLDQGQTGLSIAFDLPTLMGYDSDAPEAHGRRPEQLRGTLQNDILKEYTPQKEFIFPPEPSMRLVVDTIEFGTQHLPQWNTISISGYHIREAGSTAAQELAFTLLDGMEYVRWGLARGLPIDEIGRA